MKVDYVAIMQGYHGSRDDGFLTDTPVGIKLAEDTIIQTRYDAQSMQWIFSRPLRIKYPGEGVVSTHRTLRQRN